jgi:Family of unknown function (DUF5318)
VRAYAGRVDAPARSVIDYALARRATLADLFAGRRSSTEVCDAHPYLLRAARYHGRPTERACPVCRRERLVDVTYVYGDELRESSGQARAVRDLAGLASRYRELNVYVVEVCGRCAWNHLITSFVVGTGDPVPERATRRRAGRT